MQRVEVALILMNYLTKFLLYVGIDVDVIHTVRHFLLLTRLSRRSSPLAVNATNNETGWNSALDRPSVHTAAGTTFII